MTDFEKDSIKFCAIIDDVSRKILSEKFENANTESSIAIIERLVEEYWNVMPMRELIMDNVIEFGAHRGNGKKEWG